MPIEQAWFEMAEIRKRRITNAVWVPLRAINTIKKTGNLGYVGFCEEFSGAGSLAVPIENKDEVRKLGWDDIGIRHEHGAYVDLGRYIASDVYEGFSEKPLGIHLVLEQRINREELRVWHLHQDFVIALGLLREGDRWVRPNEDYIEVARLSRHPDGWPHLMEVRSEFLRDYLCARNMGLYITLYRNREEVVEDVSHIKWIDDPMSEINNGDRWEGRITPIHEGGFPYGAETAVFHMSRTDVDPGEDVPVFDFPADENVSSKSWTFRRKGKKLFVVQGELWRNEWIDPDENSPRIRRDKIPIPIFFITDASGKREPGDTLMNEGRWLWFKPEVIMSLAHRRGGALGWHTRDTGFVRCSPDNGVRFGINELGLINVYAKDIGLLPEWQQRIWAGFNVGPEGGVSHELLASQMQAMPAKTIAPERRLPESISRLNQAFQKVTGKPLISDHPKYTELMKLVHRFRATDQMGLFALAKDLARLTADSIDLGALQTIVSPPKGEQWRSLKSLEKVLATAVTTEEAHTALTPLFGIYELRHADAHLPGSEVNKALQLAGINTDEPYMRQGLRLIEVCVEALESVSAAIGKLDKQV